jgi:hypothetical protein
MLAGHRRRREAADRLPRLMCSCGDPWVCRHYDGPPSERQLDAYQQAAEHLLDHGLLPAPNIPAMRRMWRRGGTGLKLVMHIAQRWEQSG